MIDCSGAVECGFVMMILCSWFVRDMSFWITNIATTFCTSLRNPRPALPFEPNSVDRLEKKFLRSKKVHDHESRERAFQIHIGD